MKIMLTTLVLATAMLAPVSSFAAAPAERVRQAASPDNIEALMRIAKDGQAVSLNVLLSKWHFPQETLSIALGYMCFRGDYEGLDLVERLLKENPACANAKWGEGTPEELSPLMLARGAAVELGKPTDKICAALRAAGAEKPRHELRKVAEHCNRRAALAALLAALAEVATD